VTDLSLPEAPADAAINETAGYEGEVPQTAADEDTSPASNLKNEQHPFTEMAFLALKDQLPQLPGIPNFGHKGKRPEVSAGIAEDSRLQKPAGFIEHEPASTAFSGKRPALFDSASSHDAEDGGAALIDWTANDTGSTSRQSSFFERASSSPWAKSFVSSLDEADATDDPNNDIMVVLSGKGESHASVLNSKTSRANGKRTLL